jgi:hypothetical protein
MLFNSPLKPKRKYLIASGFDDQHPSGGFLPCPQNRIQDGQGGRSFKVDAACGAHHEKPIRVLGLALFPWFQY